jgi:hypothetical protein
MRTIFWLLFYCWVQPAFGKFLQVKSADAVAKKWAARAGAAGADYQSGVQNTTKDWAADTVAAATAWGAGVQTAIGNRSFEKGVNAAGTAKWKAKAAGVGAARYPQGVAAAQPFYMTGIQPVLAALASITLPPRGPKGDPGNLQRVAGVNIPLRKLKTGG